MTSAISHIADQGREIIILLHTEPANITINFGVWEIVIEGTVSIFGNSHHTLYQATPSYNYFTHMVATNTEYH